MTIENQGYALIFRDKDGKFYLNMCLNGNAEDYLKQSELIRNLGGEVKLSIIGLSEKQEEYFLKLTDRPKITYPDLENIIIKDLKETE